MTQPFSDHVYFQRNVLTIVVGSLCTRLSICCIHFLVCVHGQCTLPNTACHT